MKKTGFTRNTSSYNTCNTSKHCLGQISVRRSAWSSIYIAEGRKFESPLGNSATEKLCQSSSKWYLFSNHGRIKAAKEEGWAPPFHRLCPRYGAYTTHFPTANRLRKHLSNYLIILQVNGNFSLHGRLEKHMRQKHNTGSPAYLCLL